MVKESFRISLQFVLNFYSSDLLKEGLVVSRKFGSKHQVRCHALGYFIVRNWRLEIKGI